VEGQKLSCFRVMQYGQSSFPETLPITPLLRLV